MRTRKMAKTEKDSCARLKAIAQKMTDPLRGFKICHGSMTSFYGTPRISYEMGKWTPPVSAPPSACDNGYHFSRDLDRCEQLIPCLCQYPPVEPYHTVMEHTHVLPDQSAVDKHYEALRRYCRFFVVQARGPVHRIRGMYRWILHPFVMFHEDKTAASSIQLELELSLVKWQLLRKKFQ